MWANVYTLPVGGLVGLDCCAEAVIDTVLWPADWWLASRRAKTVGRSSEIVIDRANLDGVKVYGFRASRTSGWSLRTGTAAATRSRSTWKKTTRPSEMGMDATGAPSCGDGLMSWINGMSEQQARIELMKMGVLPIPKPAAKEAKVDDQTGSAVPAEA